MEKWETKMKRIWREFTDQCVNCGANAEIFTDENFEKGEGCDGDPMRCSECGSEGYFSVIAEDDAYAVWC